MKLRDEMTADLADTLKADEEDRKTDRAPLVAVTENEEVAKLTATIETNFRQDGAVVKEEVATETETRAWSVLFGRGEPIVIAVKTRHTLWCCVSLSHDLSQFHWKGDICDEWDIRTRSLMKRSSQSMRWFDSSSSSLVLMIDHLIRDRTEAFPLSNKFPKCFPLPFDAALRQHALIFVG